MAKLELEEARTFPGHRVFWNNRADSSRSANRAAALPNLRDYGIGFRVLRRLHSERLTP